MLIKKRIFVHTMEFLLLTKLNSMLDIHIHTHDKKSHREIKAKLDRIITLLEKEDDEIEDLDLIIEDLETIIQKVKTIV